MKFLVSLCIVVFVSLPASGQADSVFVEKIKSGLTNPEFDFTSLYLTPQEFHEFLTLQTHWDKNTIDQSLMEVNAKYSEWKSAFQSHLTALQEDFHATLTIEELKLVWDKGFTKEKNNELWFSNYFTLKGKWIDKKKNHYDIVLEFLAVNYNNEWILMSPINEINP